jgi:sugar lactone lactonase YvrE
MAAHIGAELVLDAAAQLGEGPLWDTRDHVLRWTDIAGRELHRYDPATGIDDVVTVDREVGALVPRASGGLMLAVRGGFAGYDDGQLGPLRLLVEVEGDQPQVRMNDGKCDSAGRFYASTMASDAGGGAGALWRLDADLSVHRLVDGLTVGNGMAWTADGSTMYFIDTTTHRVDAFTVDVATGALSDRRPVVHIPPEDGLPDGMCIDDEGCLWVALWDGWAVRRYSPAGELLAVVALPVARVTCPTFGGPGLDELYVTTAGIGLDDEARAKQPEAGGVFRAGVGVSGPAAFSFAG